MERRKHKIYRIACTLYKYTKRLTFGITNLHERQYVCTNFDIIMNMILI